MGERLPQVESELAKAKEELLLLRKQEADVFQRVRDMRLALEEAQQRENAQKSTSFLLNALMGEKKSGRIPGIYGRLVRS